MDLQHVFDYLAEEGYRPQRDADGDITFKKEGKFCVINGYPNDKDFIRVSVPNIWEIEYPAELEQAIRQANRMTCGIKCAKVFVIENRENVWATIEMFVPDLDTFITVLPRCLDTVIAAAREFQEAMQAAMAEDAEPNAAGLETSSAPHPSLH